MKLVVRRAIRADCERLFEAWTRPEELMTWWGPRPVRCAGAAVDLRVGGRYRIDNQLPDGTRVIIEGEFTVVERPHRLVYTWSIAPGGSAPEVVTVQFDPAGDGLTEVVVTHERIADPDRRTSHANGWAGCLDGLGRHVAADVAGARR